MEKQYSKEELKSLAKQILVNSNIILQETSRLRYGRRYFCHPTPQHHTIPALVVTWNGYTYAVGGFCLKCGGVVTLDHLGPPKPPQSGPS